MVSGRWSRSFLRRQWSVFFPICLFSILWLDLIHLLSFQWSTNEQYAYGWFVPILAAGLFWNRWHRQPEPHCQSTPWWLIALIIASALLILPVRVLYEANPDWPLCSWLLAFLVLGISLYLVYLAGDLAWLGHFAFPLCFLLVAVRWPYRIEHGLTQVLMGMVSWFTVKVLALLDVMAIQRGNLIELSTGVVGIEEACAGIRSFQSTLMGALFLGELYRFTWPQRIKLVLGGVALSLCFNVLRTLTLTWYASDKGIDAIKQWHDPAGFSVFLLCFASLWLLAWLIQKRATAKALAEQAEEEELHGPVNAPSIPPPRETSFIAVATAFPIRRLLTVVGGWAVCILVLNEIWYVAHELTAPKTTPWTASLPSDNATFQTVELTPRVLEVLKSDLNITGKWSQESGLEWTAFFLRWKPQSIPSLIRARRHRPEVCLPAIGYRQITGPLMEYFDVGPLKLPFQKFVYEAHGTKIYVFFCLWQDGDEEQQGIRLLERNDRFAWVKKGRRRMGQQSLEIVLSGCSSLKEAEQEVRKHLPSLIRIGEPAV